MKKMKSLLTLAGALLVLTGCGTSKDVVIEGKIEGLPQGAVLSLTPGNTHQREEVIATAEVDNGEFTFTLPGEGPRVYYIGIEGANGQFSVIAETGNHVKITGIAILNGEWWKFDDITITGSEMQKQYDLKIAPRAGLDQMYADLRVLMDSLAPIRQQALEAGNEELAAEIYEQMMAEEKKFFDTVESITEGIIKENSQTFWGPLLALDMFSYFTEEQRGLYEGFSDEAKQSHYGLIMKRYVAPDSAVGEPLAAFTLADNKGGQITVSQASSGKKFVLVDFWASWCAPCRKEIPNLKALYDKYSAQGFEIVSISIDSDRKAWEKALEEEQLPWPNFLDEGPAAKACNVRAVPTMFLLDEKGIVLEENIRGEALENKLAEIFN